MAETIIYVVICTIVAMIFVILGIYQYRAKDPVTIVLSRINGVIAIIIIFVAVLFEFFWINFQHKKMKREYIK